MIRTAFLAIALLAVTGSGAFGADHKHLEAVYQNFWCEEKGGHKEVTLKDGTRADCVTATHAVEVNHARQWADGIGQALHYALQTGKTAGIVLILETPGDLKYWDRLNATVQHFKLPVDIWQIKPEDLN